MFVRLLVIGLLAVVAWAGFAHTSEGAGPEQVYVVQPADTLWSIAAAHYAGDPREAIWELQERNDLAGTTLQPGQRLILP
jgi:LysM repeat protein